jgi:hypothetical protein
MSRRPDSRIALGGGGGGGGGSHRGSSIRTMSRNRCVEYVDGPSTCQGLGFIYFFGLGLKCAICAILNPNPPIRSSKPHIALNL